MVHIDETEYVLADIPGLIEGAHEGHGLGDRFLGHVERCGVLLHLVDGTQDDVAGAYRTVRAELEAYGHGLSDKPEIVVLNKMDAIDQAALPQREQALRAACGHQIMQLSGATGSGAKAVHRALLQAIRDVRGESADVARSEPFVP